MMFFSGAYQKILEWSMIVAGVLGIIYYIRRDAKKETINQIERKMFKDYFKEDREDAKKAETVDAMHIDDVRGMLKRTGRYYP